MDVTKLKNNICLAKLLLSPANNNQCSPHIYPHLRKWKFFRLKIDTPNSSFIPLRNNEMF